MLTRGYVGASAGGALGDLLRVLCLQLLCSKKLEVLSEIDSRQGQYPTKQHYSTRVELPPVYIVTCGLTGVVTAPAIVRTA